VKYPNMGEGGKSAKKPTPDAKATLKKRKKTPCIRATEKSRKGKTAGALRNAQMFL